MAIIAGPRDNETNNLSEYSASSATGSSTIAINTTAVKNGTYGLQAVCNNSGSDNADTAEAQVNFTYPASTVLVARVWLQFASFTSGGYGTAISKGVLILRDSGEAYASVRLVVIGTRQIQASYYNTAFGNVAGSASLTLTSATWYMLELKLDKSGANPVITFRHSADGSSFTTVETITATDGVRGSPDSARTGICHVGQFEKGIYTVYADDFTIYDADVAGGGPSARTSRLSLVGVA